MAGTISINGTFTNFEISFKATDFLPPPNPPSPSIALAIGIKVPKVGSFIFDTDLSDDVVVFGKNTAPETNSALQNLFSSASQLPFAASLIPTNLQIGSGSPLFLPPSSNI